MKLALLSLMLFMVTFTGVCAHAHESQPGTLDLRQVDRDRYEVLWRAPIYFGKPHPPIYDLARRRLAALMDGDPQILCIGDGVSTDVQGGIAENLDTLFVTGGIEAAAFGPDPAQPDPELLEDWLEDHQLSPSYAIGHLR